MELFDVLKARAGIPVSDPMAVMFGRKKSRPAYDESKITLVLLDESGSRTDSAETFVRFDDAKAYLDEHSDEMFDFVLGSEWSRSDDPEDDHYINVSESTPLSSTNLINVEIKGFIGDLWNLAFYRSWNGSKLKSITIHENAVTTIGDEVFFNCRYLENADIQGGVTSLGKHVFQYCDLKEIELPDSILSIGIETFWGCNELNYVKLPANMTTIPAGTFYGCSALERVVFPPSLTTIEQNAFAACSSLQSIEIPGTVESIQNGAFTSCTNLKEIIIPKPMGGITGAPWNAPNTTTVTWIG